MEVGMRCSATNNPVALLCLGWIQVGRAQKSFEPKCRCNYMQSKVLGHPPCFFEFFLGIKSVYGQVI